MRYIGSEIIREYKGWEIVKKFGYDGCPYYKIYPIERGEIYSLPGTLYGNFLTLKSAKQAIDHYLR